MSDPSSLVLQLEQFEYKYDTAQDGDEAIRMMIDCAFDVVLLDLATPAVNAFVTVARIRELEEKGVLENRAAVFMMRTGGQPEVSEQTGVEGVQEKPLQKEVLHQVLRDRLQRHTTCI